MPRDDGYQPVIEYVAEFEARLRELAWDLARAVLAQELGRTRSPAVPPVRKKPSTIRGARSPRPGTSNGQSAAAAAGAPAPDMPATIETSARAHRAATAAAPTPPAKGGWTRDRVVSELAQWLLEDSTIDAATLTRRGHGSLASWARRLFGRFEAALNAANLHLAERYPDGPPTRAARLKALSE